MHALLSSNSEWVYVYLLWKGQKPKTFVKPTAEDFIEKLGFRNIIILGSEIIPQNRQEEQINSGHKVLEVTYMKLKQDSSPQNKTKKMTKAKVKKADTTNSKITTSKYQKRSEFHELSHKEDTQSHPELRNTDSNRPEKNDASFSNISTSNSILKSNVCQPRSGSERAGKIYCSKTLESSQNMVKKDVLLIAPVRMESTTETNVGCLKTSESLPSQPLDKVTTTNSANLESTPETNVDKVGYSREFDLKLKNCKGNKSNNRQNHLKEEDVKDVSEYMYNIKHHKVLDVNRRSVISEPVPSQSDIDKDIHLLTLACLPAKKDKIRCNKNQNREQYECVSSSGHTSFGCSQKTDKENILTVSPLPDDVSPGLGETVLSAASVSSLRSEIPSDVKQPVENEEDASVLQFESMKQTFETTDRVDVTSGGEAAGDCHGSLKFAIFSEDLLVQQVTEKVLAEMRKMNYQSWEAKPCMCLSQHKNVSNRSDASVQTDSVELVSDSAQTYATGEILFSQVFH
ncbi:uncharacterized protein LOC143256382 isoform X2 [Tachypleus tridentatus]|uniref:uncharacterized protein LOC143256382 isoform X2 n=1 Tax=Tachypleus tridentatus TaxID=6853 RepID=UPI003FD3FFA8